MTTALASALSTSSLRSSSSTCKHPTLCAISTSVKSYPKTKIICLPKRIPQLGQSPFSPWNGLSHLGRLISLRRVKIERKRGCKRKGVYASLLGVGAPEALVIGVVALLVFGPKGLAEIARNLGKTLREFQPTIRELQKVSREFKSTLEREIGFDEIQSSTPNTYRSNITSTTLPPSSIGSSEDSQTVIDSNGAPSPNKAHPTEGYLKITEEQMKTTAAQPQAQASPPGESKFESQTRAHDAVREAAAVPPPNQKPERET